MGSRDNTVGRSGRMNESSWQKVEELYRAARQREPRERAAFLDGACRSDSDLRLKVELLLHQEAMPSADQPTWTAAAPAASAPQLGVTLGTQLGPYHIDAALGAGGMGQVYRAHDTRLSRSVAIKVLATGSVDRFIVEARAA